MAAWEPPCSLRECEKGFGDSTPETKEMSMSLESWNDTPTKQAILDFVAAASAEGGPGYIPPAERIAAFDNDGTLWVEQPAPAQTEIAHQQIGRTGQSEPGAGCRGPLQGHRYQGPGLPAGVGPAGPRGGDCLPLGRGQGLGGHYTREPTRPRCGPTWPLRCTRAGIARGPI